MRQLCYEIKEEQDGLTVNGFARNVAGLSRGFLRSIKFRENGIRLNGVRVTTRAVLHNGDRLVFTMDYDDSQQVIPSEGAVNILFENEDLILVDKEAGVVVHPCHGHFEDTLLNHLAWHYRGGQEGQLLCPVGRLDKDTSGLILIARNKYAARCMEQERQQGQLSRIYLALTEGYFDTSCLSGVIDRPISKVADTFNRYEVSEAGRPSRTFYEVLGQGELEGQPFSIVRLKLETGRTHQIRVHMADYGHPLLGDPIYGHESLLGFNRAALHSVSIGCILPGTTEEKWFTAELPEDFRRCLAAVINNIGD
ncbi:MAG: RluA family pseudouridine synthase [Coprococcus sp.]